MSDESRSCVESGVCSVHNVEIERRRNMDKQLEHVPRLLTFMNRMVGFSMLLSLIVGGGFAYIYDTRLQSLTEHSRLDAKIEILQDRLNKNDTIMARTDEKYKTILHQLELNNSNLSILLNKLAKRGE